MKESSMGEIIKNPKTEMVGVKINNTWYPLFTDKHIANGVYLGSKDNWAIAHLFATAPYLLEALKFALEMQESVEEKLPAGYGSAPNTIAWMEEAKAAIARAEGENQED